MEPQPMPVALETPTQEERTLAFLAHLLQIFTGFIAPMIIYIVKHESRFVKFHALQSVIWQVCYMAILFGAMIAFFFTFFLNFAHHPSTPQTQGPPPGLFIFFPIIWLLMIGGWIINVILGVVYGSKANRGEWAPYPIIGKWLLRRVTRSAQTPGGPARA